MTIEPQASFAVPGLADLVKTEIGIVRMDVVRLEMQNEVTCAELTRVEREMAALKARYLKLRARREELTAKSSTERRILRKRRLVLFELEQEPRP